MGSNYTTYELGDTARIDIDCKDSSDTLTDPDAITITIYKESDNSAVVSETDIIGNKSGTGEYYYNWDTSDESLGQYKAKVKATFGSYPQVDTKFLELVEVKEE